MELPAAFEARDVGVSSLRASSMGGRYRSGGSPVPAPKQEIQNTVMAEHLGNAMKRPDSAES